MSGGFCDIHNHTLPGVDDGPKTLDEALAMARLAVERGTEVVVLTPHSEDVAELARAGLLQGRVEGLRRALEAAAIPLELHLSMENRLRPDLPRRVETGLALPFGAGPYILVELPYTETLPLYTEENLFQLQLRGLTPVIAHPERCDALAARPELLADLVRRGALAQLTAGSLAGRFGPRYRAAAEAMLAGGMAHVLASDAHMGRGPRVPDLEEGVAAAARIVGEERARAMATDLPRAILAGEPVEAAPALPRKRKRRFGPFG